MWYESGTIQGGTRAPSVTVCALSRITEEEEEKECGRHKSNHGIMAMFS